MPTVSPWRIDGHTALLQAPSLSGVIDLDRPYLGMTTLRASGVAIPGSLWGWTGEDRSQDQPSEEERPPCRDVYARGDDLIITYGPTNTCPFETQLYWTADPISAAGDACQLSLLVSIRTHLLDTEPVVRVISRRDSAECVTAEETIGVERHDSTVWQRVGVDRLWLVEACHQADQSRRLDDQPEKAVGWELFAHFLEKGVIRRGRLTMAIAADVGRVKAAYQKFHEAPLPLTT